MNRIFEIYFIFVVPTLYQITIFLLSCSNHKEHHSDHIFILFLFSEIKSLLRSKCICVISP